MIDYKEMDKVIQNLNDYVGKLQKTAETQKKLDETIVQIVNVKDDIQSLEKSIKEYTSSIEMLEDKHEKISSQFDMVLQDYKKLHSAFELLDIELKKINVHNENFEKSIIEVERLIKDYKKEIVIIQETQKSILEQQNAFCKKNKFWFGVITGLAGVILILTIVGLIV